MIVRRPFTTEDDEYIISHYATNTMKEIALHLGRNWQCVLGRVELLRHRGKVNKRDRYYRPHWTPEEDDWLGNNWGLYSDSACARHLGRTVEAIKMRGMQVQGISRRSNFYTAMDVARLFGVGGHTVIEYWIASGALRAKHSSVKAGGHQYLWLITDVAIQRFVREFPWHYNPKQMERGTWWRKLAEQVWNKDPWYGVEDGARLLGVGTGTLKRHLGKGWVKGIKLGSPHGGGVWRIAKSELLKFKRIRAYNGGREERMRA